MAFSSSSSSASVNAGVVAPKNLQELINEVRKESTGMVSADASNVLVSIIRKHKFWPALQVKKFFKNKNLVLLHNTYKRTDVSHFQHLYNQCRSVVLDMAATDNNIVVSYTDQVPERMCVGTYNVLRKEDDVCDKAYEGTLVTVYHYQDKWYFGTSACPLVDSSRYFHPTKTHGVMLDEAIAQIMGVPAPTDNEDNEFSFGVTSSEDLRKAFTHYLDTSRAYAFILVHHDNKHVVDYTPVFGANYAKLVHIVMRDRVTMQDIPMNKETVSENLWTSFIYPEHYESSQAAMDSMNSATADASAGYGFIVKCGDGRRIKVSSEEVSVREEFDLGNPNMWINMLHVYIQNKPHYKIVDYQRDYCPNLMVPYNNHGSPLAPTYIIHTVICSMRDVIYAAYIRSTTFNPHTKRFYINRRADDELSPIIRFHMAQLRNIQITTHDHALISPHAIYHYICHHQTMKNLRLLIKYFATSWISEHASSFPPRTSECFFHLDTLLSQASN